MAARMSLRPISTADRMLPELDNRVIVMTLVVLGGAGALIEIVATPFVPRLVLFVCVFALGLTGLLRRHSVRSDRPGSRRAGEPQECNTDHQ